MPFYFPGGNFLKPVVTANVTDYGAVGDGTTDNTAAITAAITAVNALGGGEVFFPQGTFVTQTLPLYSSILYMGAGIQATILQLKAGTNADLLQGTVNGYGGGVMVNVAAANASGSTGGIYNFSIQNMTLDGNKSNQSGGTSYCMRFYGFGYIISNVRMKNGYTGGVYSDWNGGGSSGIDSMESQWSNVKIHDCNALGLQYAGPHDSQFTNLLVFSSGTSNIHIGPNASAILMANAHAFSPGQGVAAASFLIEGGYGQYVNCVSEGSDTVNTVLLAGDIEWVGCHIFGIVGNVGLQQGGLQLGQAAGQTPFPGSVNQSAGLSTAVVASGCFIDSNFNLNNNFAINFANETNCIVRATCYNTSGNVIAGTPNIQSSYEVYMNGLTADGSIGKSGGAYQAIKANKAHTWGDRTQDIINFNTNSKKAEYVNGTTLVVYTDNYSTHSFETVSDANGTVKFAGDANATLARRAAGILAFGGSLALAQSSSAQVIATSGTINLANLGIGVVAPTGNVTGIKLSAGVFAGQVAYILNSSAFTVTFDISANSFVADGASDVINANVASTFVWNNLTNLWYRS